MRSITTLAEAVVAGLKTKTSAEIDHRREVVK